MPYISENGLTALRMARYELSQGEFFRKQARALRDAGDTEGADDSEWTAFLCMNKARGYLDGVMMPFDGVTTLAAE